MIKSLLRNRFIHRVATRFLPHIGHLRYPSLTVLTAIMFVVAVIVPDPIPLVDEIALGLLTYWLSQRTIRTLSPNSKRAYVYKGKAKVVS